MEIVGIGTDIVEVKRFDKSIDTFINKYFSQKEVEYFQKKNFNLETISGNFAAKEAVVKALGTGFRDINIKDLEILRDGLGKPIVVFNDERYKELDFLVSISHTKDNALASAICFRR